MRQQEPEEQNAGIESQVAEKEDIKELKQSLAKVQQEAESCLANWQRAQADFINYKRRTEQEKGEMRQMANSVLMFSLLPVLDDLERAFTAIPPELAKLSWVDGIRLVERKLRVSLEAQGLSPIKALGEPFDPKFHEAARHSKGPEGIVVEELQEGYRLYDRVLRPTMVVVGEGEKRGTESEESDTLV